eukprot:COSAG04_NODE_7004_length_1211_cov_1.290468_1_plen_403_part_11
MQLLAVSHEEAQARWESLERESAEKAASELAQVRGACSSELEAAKSAAEAEARQALERAAAEAREEIGKVVEEQGAAARIQSQFRRKQSRRSMSQMISAQRAHVTSAREQGAAANQDLVEALAREQTEAQELRKSLEAHLAASVIQSSFRRYRGRKYMRMAARTYHDLLKVHSESAENTLLHAVATVREEMTAALDQSKDEMAAAASSVLWRERNRDFDRSGRSPSAAGSTLVAGISPSMGASPKEVRVHELLLREAKAQEQLAIAEAIAEEQAVQLSACLKHVADFTEATDRQLVQQAAAATIQGHWHRRRGRQNVMSVMEALKSGRVSAVEERMPQPAAAPIQRETEALQSELLALRAETDDEIARLQVAHRRERERLQQQLKDAEKTTQPAGESSDGLAT